MLVLLRGLIGLVIGGCYGILIWRITLYINMIGVDPEHPGALIPDAVGMAQLAAFLAGAITGICGAVCGLIVGLANLKPRMAALVGGCIGLLGQALLMLPFLDISALVRSWSALRDLFFGLVMFPFGVGVVGLIVSVVVNRLKLSQQYR